jgi:hypothetical protein
VQRSFTLLLCLIDFKAEQKERDDRVVTYASRQIGARHRTPRFVVPTSDKITRLGILMCDFWATLTNHFRFANTAIQRAPGRRETAGGHSLALRSVGRSALDRRTRNRAVRTEHATITRLGFQASATSFAVIEDLAGILRHQLCGSASAIWTGDNRQQSHGRVKLKRFYSALRPLGEFFVILRNTEHYRLCVSVFHLHSYCTSLRRPASPVFGIILFV